MKKTTRRKGRAPAAPAASVAPAGAAAAAVQPPASEARRLQEELLKVLMPEGRGLAIAGYAVSSVDIRAGADGAAVWLSLKAPGSSETRDALGFEVARLKSRPGLKAVRHKDSPPADSPGRRAACEAFARVLEEKFRAG